MVLGILLIITGLSAAFYSRFLLQNAVDNTVAQITEDLRKAQMYSMSGKLAVNWGVKYSNHVLTLYDTGGNKVETFSINPNVTVSGLTDIQFAKITGNPAAAATITVSAPNLNLSKVITMSSTGVVSR